jgi:citrate synthase
MAANVGCAEFTVNIDWIINMKKPASPWLDAAEATALLGVNRATLYAYVSRGRIRSEPGTGNTRHRRYSRDDVERLRARTDERRDPQKAAGRALQWGLPVLESAITLIADGRIFYRGRDATQLATSSTIAEVAALLWTGTADPAPFDDLRPIDVKRIRGEASFIARAQIALAAAAPRDRLAYDLRPQAVVRTGWRITQLLASVAAGGVAAGAIDAALARTWDVPAATPLLRAALILCADHELNVSTFTARCVASAGATPYGVVIAGLAALEGVKHGGITARVEALWDSLRHSRDLVAAASQRLRRGESIDGFGHPLYPRGDPRAALLLSMLPRSRQTAFAHDLATAIGATLNEAPTIDYALVAISRSLGLPEGSALTLFALGRTLGWIAHALEQYAQDAIIRPRARYVGDKPFAQPASV